MNKILDNNAKNFEIDLDDEITKGLAIIHQRDLLWSPPLPPQPSNSDIKIVNSKFPGSFASTASINSNLNQPLIKLSDEIKLEIQVNK